MKTSPLERAAHFGGTLGLRVPVLLAPMAGACPVELSVAVANAGGMGAMGAVITPPAGIREWTAVFRAQSSGPFQLNTWIPEPSRAIEPGAEARMRAVLARWMPDPASGVPTGNAA